MSAVANPLKVYQQPLVGGIEGALRHCLVGAGVLGLITLVMIFLAPPLPVRDLSLDEMPERYARLILDKPEPVVSAPAADTPATRIEIPEAPPAPEPTVAKKPQPKTIPEPVRRAAVKPKVAPDKGVQGRKRATEEVTQNLAQVTGSLDKALDDLTSALPTAGAGDKASQKKPTKRRRGTRGGRGSAQLASVSGVGDLKTADIGGTSLSTDAVAIAGIADLSFGDGGGGSGSGGSGAGGSGAVGRSNQSLLAVVRRYAPGIQFCYENELKRNAGLRGKLVVSLTVAASGRVTDVSVVENSLGSDAVVGCAVEQMHGWVFPAIEAGTSTFKAPFVFTPPD